MKMRYGWLILPLLSLPISLIAKEVNNTTQSIYYSKSLPEPLIATHIPTKDDITAFHNIMGRYETHADKAGARNLLAFVTTHPDSAWAASLWFNIGILYEQDGRYSDAIEAYQQASKHFSSSSHLLSPDQARLNDGIYAAMLDLHTQLGHVDTVSALLQQSGQHKTGVATPVVVASTLSLGAMQHEPGSIFKCGSNALVALLHANDPAMNTRLLAVNAPKNGFSLGELQALAKQENVRLHAIESKDVIPVPSVVHWKSGHFAAITAQTGNSYQVVDPIRHNAQTMTTESILHETSGHYLVKDSWHQGRTLSSDEAGNIRGAGITTGKDNYATSNDDVTDCGHCQKGAGSSDETSTATPNSRQSSAAHGMPQYSVSSMLVSLKIEDTPVSYQPPVGNKINFTITYNELEATQPVTFAFSNVGAKWSHNWMGWVQDDPSKVSTDATLVLAGGGGRKETGYNSTSGAYTRERQTGAILRLTSTSPITYVRTFPDGSTETYAQSDNSTVSPRRIFLTEKKDASGNKVSLSYDNQLRLISLTDALKQQTVFEYGDTTKPYLITAVTDPFGRKATLEYDSTLRLVAVTDAVNMRSTFGYSDSSATTITSMTTPYGKSTFKSVTTNNGNQTRWLEATDPAGNTERVEFSHNATGIATSDSQSLVPTIPQEKTAGLFNSWLLGRNTFYWDKTTYKSSKNADGSMIYTNALIHHWEHTDSGSNSLIAAGTQESIKYPLENRIWLTYPDQVWSAGLGSLDKPNHIGRVLSDGTTQLKSYTYNGYGNVLTYTDPKGRVTTYTYADNGQDILTVKQGTKTIASYTWNDKHKPLTETDAAGKVTTYTYNDRNQVLTKTNALGEVTTWQYDANGYLLKVIGSGSKTVAKYTYDTAGRVATYTDGASYALAYEYDNLDRLTKVTYPDSTTQTYTWDKLNVASSQDRLGRTTSYTYDALGRLTAETDPMSKTTQYGYYENGRLKTLTDARGKVTTWNRDIEGRVTSKVLADGSTTTLTYDNASRLVTQKDAAGQTKSFTYTADDQVAAIAYTSTSNPTTGVSFTYDTTFPYVTAMTDSTGTTAYTYGDVGQNGALQPLTETPPSPRQAISYTYDDLGRAKTRTVGSQTEQWTYDSLGRLLQNSNALGVFDYTYFMNSDKVYSEALQGSTWRTDYRYGTVAEDRQLQQILHPTTISVAKSVFMGYDASGRMVTRHDWPQGQHDKYQYDDADRVTQVQRGVWQGLRLESEQPLWTTPAIETSTYTYDDGDNLTDIRRPSSHQVFGVNDVNQMVSRNSMAPAYDANGNVLDDGYFTYTWDAENRLKTVTKKSTGDVSTFAYDGLSRRISIAEKSTDSSGTVTTSTTYYQWCGVTLCQALDASGNTTERYVPQGEQVNSQNRYYAKDALGSVMQLVDASGNLLGNLQYNAYGALEVKSGSAPRFGYAGMFRHAASGLNLTLYRAYHPQIGRWLSRDPIGENGGINLYGYVRNNPLNYIDPYGLNPATAAEGAAIGFGIGGPPGAVVGGAIGFGLGAWGTYEFWSWYKNENANDDEPKPCPPKGKESKPPFNGPPNGYEEGPRRGREYGSDGKPSRDYDNPHQGVDYPHVHEWPNGEREHPGRPYSPIPKK